ncbi:MAG: universal stress protein [Caldilineaceae bacterium]
MKVAYETIVIPLDGSPLAEEVFVHVKRLALPTKTELHLVGVLEAWRYAMVTSDLAMTDLITYLRNDLQSYLAQQAHTLQQQGYSVAVHCRDGDAALTIIDVANAVGAQLIAMTTHGRSGVRRWTLGSVAERLIHETNLPVLLVRKETVSATTIKRLLVPLDGSSLAEEALLHAVALAKSTGASLLLLHVIQAIDPTNQRLLFHTKAEAESALHQWTLDGENYLTSVGQRLQQQGVTAEGRVRVGDPDRMICATAVDAAIDMVVMSTHGRTGIKRWVYGSVANKVLRGIECPLLLIHNQVDDTPLD